MRCTVEHGDHFCRLIDDCPPPCVKAEEIYDCSSEGKPILHNTVIHLCVERDLQMDGQYASFIDQTRADEQLESVKVGNFP